MTHIVTPDGTTLFYQQETSEKRDLILIGGLSTNHTIWDLVLPFLSPHYRILRFDNRGAGQSKSPNTSFSITDMANDVITLMNHLAIENAFLVGHSMGGAILQQLLIDHPNRINKAVICGSFAKLPLTALIHCRTMSHLRRLGVPESTIMEANIPWVLSSAFIEERGPLTQMIDTFLAADRWPQSAADYDAQVAALAQFDLRESIQTIQKETLVIAGSEDLLTPPSCSITIHQAIQGSTYHVIEGSGHMLLFEYPETLAQRIHAFCTLNH